RDSLLSAAGTLDERVGGPPQELNNPNNKKRTVYARIRRTGADGMMSLFDFPDPTVSGDQRSVTNVPLQGLFFLNSELVWRQAERVAERLNGVAAGNDAKIHKAYRLLYGRNATERELRHGLKFLGEAGADAASKTNPWQQYAHVLLSSGEFLYLN